MIISDLTYLETASEVSTIVGGGRQNQNGGGRRRNSNTQNNTIVQSLEQNATAVSVADGRNASSGDATAVNFGFNFANISDNNQEIVD
jgi:hypothetical protein